MATPNDIAAGVQNLKFEGRRKKKPQRAFHDLNQPSSNWVSPAASEYHSTPQNHLSPQQSASFQAPAFASQNNHFSQPNLLSPQTSQPYPGYQDFSQTQPGLPNRQHPGPPHMANEDAHDVAFDLSRPKVPSADSTLSLGKARHDMENEYTTLLYDEQGQCVGTKPFLSFENIVPPYAGTQYFAVDQSTATPKHMRSTFYNVPESEELRKATRLPMAVTIRPFAPLLSTEEPVPTVDMSRLGEASLLDPEEWGPPRCRRCRTYINPAMVHDMSGRFTCNVCQFPNNSVPQEYAAPLDQNGQRIDRPSRPELSRGVYDIIVPKFYHVGGADKEPEALHHVFLVDVCQHSIKQELNAIVADAIRATLAAHRSKNGNDEGKRQKFAIIMYDKAVHFFNLSASLEATQICVSPDLEDPFVPFHEGLFADADESEMVIEDALNHLEMFGKETTLHDPEPCFAVACRAAMMCLEAVGGGKITAVLSTLPSWGPGGSKLKQNSLVGRSPSAEMEKKLYSADNEYLKLLAKDMITNNVGVDIFIASGTPADLSNLGWLASVTGGRAFKWSRFNYERDSRALIAQIVNSVVLCTGYQGILKLRCSNGLQVAQYYGFPSAEGGVIGLTGISQDPAIPVVNQDQTFTILFEYDGTLNTKYDCHFQAALLYTDAQGVRKVRVMNLVCAVSERLEDVFNFVDQDAVTAALVRDTLSFVGKESIAELRSSINAKLVEVFSQYRLMEERDHNKTRSLTNQLIFPDSLRHIPLFVMAFTKSKALRDSSHVSIDDRLVDVYSMLNMPLERLSYHLCPALVEVHSLADDDCMPIEEGVEDPFIKLPEYLPLTAQSLQPSVYILCNGTEVYVWIHPDSNQQLLADLFGAHVSGVADIDTHLDSLPELDTHISVQVRNLIRHFHAKIIGSSTVGQNAVQIVIDGKDELTRHFRDNLLEDALATKTANTSPNYATFLTSLHKAVTVKVDSDRKNYKKPTHSGPESTSFAQRLLRY